MRSGIRDFVPLFLLLIIGSSARTQEISLSAKVNSTDIPFESTVDLSLEVRWNGGSGKFAFAILPLPGTQNLKVLGTTSAIADKIEAGQEITTRTFQYTFRPTQSGVGIIEPIVLKYVSLPDSTPGELTSQQFQVLIAAPLPPPVKSHFVRNLVAVIAVLLVGTGLLVFVKRRRAIRVVKEHVRTPEEDFLDGLSLARKEAASDRKIFYTRLYKLLIAFLEKKYGMPSSGKATATVLQELEGLNLPVGEKDRISDWLSTAEKEKYAPLTGEPGDIIRLYTELENYFRR